MWLCAVARKIEYALPVAISRKNPAPHVRSDKPWDTPIRPAILTPDARQSATIAMSTARALSSPAPAAILAAEGHTPVVLMPTAVGIRSRLNFKDKCHPIGAGRRRYIRMYIAIDSGRRQITMHLE
jgi:hypothetical protein